MIHVVGGSYFEQCREPSWRFLFGSGFRAAVQLRSMGVPVQLHTCVGEADHELVEASASAYGVHLDVTEIPQTVTFSYQHGLSTPEIIPDPRRNDYFPPRPTISVSSKDAVCFGLIEADIDLKTGRAVYDPQSPTKPAPFATCGSAEELVLIANRTEIRLLGKSNNIESASRRILRNERAEAVIAKMGTDGCLVVTAKSTTRVPAFRTSSVFPIGSGDIFSAAFACAWLRDGKNFTSAAAFASRSAAIYCSTRVPASRKLVQSTRLEPLKPKRKARSLRVYLAGPFFNVGQRWVIEEVRAALIGCGLHVFSPLHDVGHGLAEDVYRPDIDGLKKSKVVLACLDGLDAGTLYEIGYAQSLGHKVIVLVGPERPEDLKMIYGGGCAVTDDLTTAVYLTSWAATSA